MALTEQDKTDIKDRMANGERIRVISADYPQENRGTIRRLIAEKFAKATMKKIHKANSLAQAIVGDPGLDLSNFTAADRAQAKKILQARIGLL